jgi:hypothetical protein
MGKAAAVRRKEAPPTTMKSDGLWVGLQIEEPGTIQHLRTL